MLIGTVTVIFLLISIALLLSSALEGQVHITGRGSEKPLYNPMTKVHLYFNPNQVHIYVSWYF